uniref:Uncharacterized protein n=1 Tax=Arundo donax TaxID=35708 RepID=A0A0A9ASR5_ARUDO
MGHGFAKRNKHQDTKYKPISGMAPKMS